MTIAQNRLKARTLINPTIERLIIMTSERVKSETLELKTYEELKSEVFRRAKNVLKTTDLEWQIRQLGYAQLIEDINQQRINNR